MISSLKNLSFGVCCFALCNCELFAQTTVNTFMQMFGLNETQDAQSDEDESEEPVDPLIGLANTITQMNIRRAQGAGGSGFRPIPEDTGSSSYRPIPNGDRANDPTPVRPGERTITFGAANVSGQEGNLYRQACQGKTLGVGSRQAGMCLAWKATGEQNMSAVANASIPKSVGPSQPSTTQQNSNKSYSDGSYPADQYGRACIAVSALPAVPTSSTKEYAEGKNAYGNYYDIVFRHSIVNNCNRPINFLWAYQDRFYRGKPNSSRIIPGSSSSTVSCQKNLASCNGQITYNSSWP